ncbi:class I SAM-dependent methyltransferase [Desulfonatronospira sp.]|uniref:class I SAM-dependent methyltransferase n=1 Tax=Desulfonatronospira sp. TaxID=1962951 RepID=UPI0025C1E476|nr:class I SAM-dependent methyltransferase [Desulfonatronospira sp.]
MKKLDNDCLAAITFEISWESPEAVHREFFMAGKANIWRDIFPEDLKEALLGQPAGGEAFITCDPGQAVPARNGKDIISTRPETFQRRQFLGRPVQPCRGRFYPRGMLSGSGFFSADMRPCRVVYKDNTELKADCAHPLSDYRLEVRARLEDLAAKECETGGRMNHWMEEILGSGPGMQARQGHLPTDFYSPYAFERIDDTDDTGFYTSPRFIDHIDSQAREFLAGQYARELRPDMEVLDLMSSVASHIPQNLQVKVAGLGLNAEEMQVNPVLNSHVVHDLNRHPELPYEDHSFDAVLCSLSVEYLTSPLAVTREVARVLRPGGIFLVGISNRWFPPKVVRLWQELHEFERTGFVLDLLMQAESFEKLESTSIRNWWRPADDPHTGHTWVSDPVYVVRGQKV